LRIVAILAIRNEQACLANCLKYLVENEIEFAIIDNGSTDGSDAILREPRFSPWLVAHRFQPFDGVFDLKQLLMMKQEIIRTIDADWVIHLDADEIMHPYRPGESLRAGITRLDSEGWDVINYDEFVFLPIDRAYVTDCEDMQPLRYYYFFESENRTLMRAWGKDTGLSNVEFAGHKLSGGEFRIAPESFVLRHYIFRDQEHAFTKYLHRRHKPENAARGWHFNRHNQPVAKFAFPAPASLHCLQFPEARDFRKDDPRTKHYWQW
jgi:glycosyltransferase involved in cell wall biosynthesis